GALVALQGYVWPGNVRQLKNLVEWLIVTSPKPVNGEDVVSIQSSELPQEITQFVHASLKGEWQTDMISLPLREAREVFEREYLLAQITRFNGNISRTAQFVGMERSALHRKLKSLHITTSEREESAEDDRPLKAVGA
ncbi:MAG TPA: helix-turn-helix domain-containing protein, partial [Alphaproteobacteria bacterium]|nr:helix-turn-helix domain-containing protein [Alphaproteobacteria bacterium]